MAACNLRRKFYSAAAGVTCVSVLLITLLLTRHAKQRYDDVQKFQRLQEYVGEVNSVSEALQALEESAFALEKDVQLLKHVVQQGFNASIGVQYASNRR